MKQISTRLLTAFMVSILMLIISGNVLGQNQYALNLNGPVMFRVLNQSELDVTGDFTIEAWIQFNNFNGRLYDREGVGRIYATNNSIRFDLDGGASLSTGDISADAGDGLWHHIAVSREGTTTRLFYDGVEKASADLALTAGTTDFSIGGQDAWYGNWDARIDEFRFSNIARYNTDFTPSVTDAPFTDDTNTILLFHFDDNTQVPPVNDGSISFSYANGRSTGVYQMSDTSYVVPTGLPLEEPISNIVITTFEQDFNMDVDTAFWAYNWSGGLISADRDGDTFKYVTDSLNNYYLGVILDFLNSKSVYLDLSNNPYISFMAKADSGAIINDVVVDSIPIGMDLIDPSGNNIAFFYTKVMIPADGQWHECAYDFSDIATAAGIDSVSKIRFNPGKDRYDGFVYYKGTVWIDDFKAGEAAIPPIPPTLVTTYNEDFSVPVNEELWRPNTGTNDDGTPIFTLTQVDSTLKYDMVQKNFWDGQFYNFTKHENIIMDLTANPYFTVKIKVDTGATYGGAPASSVLFLASPWGPDSTGTLVRQVNSPSYEVPADGQWHEYTFDFGAAIGEAMWDGTIPPGDLSQIQAILFETVKWPSTYTATFYIDDFRVGDDAKPDVGAPIQMTKIPMLKDMFWAKWTVTPTHAPMDGVTGLAKDSVGGFSDMGILVRFKDTHIDARNGSSYEAVNELNFEAGKTYTIEVIADVKNQTYSVDVTPEGGEKTSIAVDYAFRADNPQDTLNYMAMVINELEAWGGVPGSRLNPSFMNDEYEMIVTTNDDFTAQTKEFKATFDAVPTVQRLNSGIALLKGKAPINGWGAMSAIIRFTDQNTIDVRNGTQYEADTVFTYNAGTKYSFSVDVNVPNQTYSVSVTPDGGTKTVLATDYAFRAAADTLNTLAQMTIIGGPWGGAAGEVFVSNLNVFETGAPIQMTKVPMLKDMFWAKWTVTPTHAPMDGVTGLAKDSVGGFSDMGILVRFKDTHIDARNGSSYEAVNELNFEAGKTYTIEVIADVKNQTYSVDVTPEGGEKTSIAVDYAFRADNPQDTLNYMAMVINELEAWGGVPGSRLNPSFMNDEYEMIVTTNDEFTAQTGTFTATFDAVPTVQRLNSGIALLKGDAPINGWGAMSTIIRFNDQNKVDVRNGGSYEAINEFEYVAGTMYSFKVDVNVTNNTYSVSVTPEGGSETVLATDYAFRATADTLNTLAQMTIIGGPWGGASGEIIVSNFEVVETGVEKDNTIPTVFAISQNYPNPFNPSTTIKYDIPKVSHVKIIIYNALGQKVTELVNKQVNPGRYQVTFNASNLASGLYFYNIQAGDFNMTKKMMLLK